MTSKKEPATAEEKTTTRRRRLPARSHSAEVKAQAVLAMWTERVKTAEVMRTLGVPYMTLQQWQDAIKRFNDERDWSTPEYMKDLLLNVVEEVGDVADEVRLAMAKISPDRTSITIAVPPVACEATISAPRACSATYCT